GIGLWRPFPRDRIRALVLREFLQRVENAWLPRDVKGGRRSSRPAGILFTSRAPIVHRSTGSGASVSPRPRTGQGRKRRTPPPTIPPRSQPLLSWQRPGSAELEHHSAVYRSWQLPIATNIFARRSSA